MLQYESHPFAWRKPFDEGFDPLAKLQDTEGLFRVREAVLRQVVLALIQAIRFERLGTPAIPPEVQADVDCNPCQPCRERRLASEVPDRFVGAKKRLLKNVFRVIRAVC